MAGAGAANTPGGKTWLVCFWIWMMMNSYKDLCICVARKETTHLYTAFASTFRKVLDFYKDNSRRYRFTQDGILNLKTHSRVEYFSLMDLPSDSEFNRCGSHEYSFAVIEEAQEVSFKAFSALLSRIGRHHNKEYGLKSKLVLTCNPGPGFIYTEFYKKRNDPVFNLENKVVLATSADNLENLDADYLNNLEHIPDPVLRKRILEGCWETGDAFENIVIPYSTLVQCLTTPYEPDLGIMRLGIDIGGSQGYSDKTIVQPLKNNLLLEPIVIKSSEYQGPAWGYDKWLGDKIIELILSYGITDYRNVRVDSSGIGAPIYAYLRNQGFPVFAFRGDAKPLQRKFTNKNSYLNLRTQAYYELAEKFRLQKIKLPDGYNELLISDLSSVRYTQSGDRLALEDKKFVRRRLGRSPDYGDAAAMACLDLQIRESAYSNNAVTQKEVAPKIIQSPILINNYNTL